MKNVAVCLLFSALMIVQSAKSSESPTVKHHMKFLPITISLACTAETPLFDQLQSARADGATAEVKPVECIDKRNSINGVQPITVAVGINERINEWDVIIGFDGKDAKNIDAWSVSRVGRRFLISAGGRVVSSANLNGPFAGERLYMSAESKKSAHNLSMLFIEPAFRW